jgi:hypothetical protein
MAKESLLTKKQLIEKLKTFDSYKETKEYILNKELKGDLIEKLEKVSKKPISSFEVGITPKTKKETKETETKETETPKLDLEVNLNNDLTSLDGEKEMFNNNFKQEDII